MVIGDFVDLYVDGFLSISRFFSLCRTVKSRLSTTRYSPSKASQRISVVPSARDHFRLSATGDNRLKNVSDSGVGSAGLQEIVCYSTEGH